MASALDATTITTTQPVGTVTKDGKVTKSGDTMDKDSFMKLLIAQLKYQDPSKPADSGEFMAQSAQFSMMESLQNMAKEQAALVTSQQSATATSMIGQKITATATTGDKDIVGTVTGVRLGTDGPVLKVGNMEVPYSSVKEVSKA